ncbi:MAG: endolytic transglycosylase MltG [Saprospiraceae bacterium]|nr:endolytic transglycosylase MltG [Saprospiraceae bacterium]
MDLKKRKILALLILVSSILFSTASFYIYSIIKAPNILVDQDDATIYIYPGTSFKSLRDSLFRVNIVHELVPFAFVSKVMKYQENVKPGKYKLKKNMSNVEAIRLLRSGAQEVVNVRFSHGRYVEDILGELTEDVLADSTKLSALVNNDNVVKGYGFLPETFISMFIPNTYQMYWLTDEVQILDRIKYEYDQFWNEERIRKLKDLGMSKVEVSTLASIVDSETAMSDEKPKVAGLYVNRLKQGYKLQADPTLVFAHGDFTIKRVLDKHKEIDSPYNTYKHYGLPPGPIRLPSISGIDAVLNYEKHDYLYFCAKEDFSGYHNFAKTYTQHLMYAEKYHRALNRNKIYK